MPPPKKRPWRLICNDTFDRDSTPSVEGRGMGLEEGLAALWSKHLAEGVQDDGRPSFSSFHLSLDEPAEAVYLGGKGPAAGVVALRRWKDDADRLAVLAAAHARLHDAARPGAAYAALVALAAQVPDELSLLLSLRQLLQDPIAGS